MTRPNLKWCKGQAKKLLRALEAGDATALERLEKAGGRAANHTSCLHVIAVEHGFRSWEDLRTSEGP